MQPQLAFTHLLLCALLAAMPTLAQRPPQEVTATYRLTRGSIPIGVMQERFVIVDQRFHIVSESKATGLFILVQPKAARFTSTGRITAQGLQPERFDAGRGADDPRRVSADFDWDNARLAIRHDGREQTFALAPGTQDRLSVMYQFMFVNFDGLLRMDVAMTNGRKLGHYVYDVMPGVEIDTALGRMRTLHLVRRHEPGDTQTEVWLAPAHAHLPVKVLVVEEDGVRYEQNVTALHLRP
jgi:hypothetical protein